MWCSQNVQEVEQILKTNTRSGLTIDEVKQRQQKYGKNKLEEGKKTNIFIRFLKQFNDFMIIILIIASIISAGISYIEHSNDYVDSVIIIGIVILNAIMGVIQESKAEQSIEALQKLTAPQAKVKRNGQVKIIPSEDLVPGDIVIIEAGSYVPADIRLINTYNFKVEESALTGETIPVEKNANSVINSNSNLGDMENLAFSTTIAVSGHAEGIVTEIGMNTRVGKIAKMIIIDEAPETPLQKRLRRSWKKTWYCSTCNMWSSSFDRFIEKNSYNGNLYDFCGSCSCSDSRRFASCCYNYAVNWNY